MRNTCQGIFLHDVFCLTLCRFSTGGGRMNSEDKLREVLIEGLDRVIESLDESINAKLELLEHMEHQVRW